MTRHQRLKLIANILEHCVADPNLRRDMIDDLREMEAQCELASSS